MSEQAFPSKILAIDPSVNDVGFATLQIKIEDGQKAFYWNWGVWHLDGWNLLYRCRDLIAYIQQTENDDFDWLICEWPMFYESEKGQIAAQESYTINLAAVAMHCVGYFHTPVERVELITAPQWKGNASKQITARRFMKQFGVDALQEDHNAIDAVMLLLAQAEKHGWLAPL